MRTGRVRVRRRRRRKKRAHVAFLAEGVRIRVGNVAVEVALGDFDLGLESVPQPTEERLGLGQDRREGRVDVVDAVVQALLLAEVLRLELTVIASEQEVLPFARTSATAAATTCAVIGKRRREPPT